jgi:hypothetical protein
MDPGDGLPRTQWPRQLVIGSGSSRPDMARPLGAAVGRRHPPAFGPGR